MRNIEGKKFNKLTVIGFFETKIYNTKRGERGHDYWVCECDCGNIKIIRHDHLVTSAIVSCTCVARIRAADRLRTHGYSKTPTSISYGSMIARIYKPQPHQVKSYKNIRICKRWLGKNGFINFIKDMGPRPDNKTLDRIDNNGDYTPKNCKWSTKKEQMLNQKRNSDFYKEYLSLNAIVPYYLYRQRVLGGWDKIKASTTVKMKNQYIVW